MSQIDKAFQKFAKNGGALQCLRSLAFDELTQLSLPTKKEEEWKYTSPKAFLEASWDESPQLSSALNFASEPFYQMQSQATLVFVDGALKKDLSKGSIKTSDLNEELIKSFSDRKDFFERMNLALLNEGVHLELESREYELPIVIIFASTQSASEQASNYRVTVKVPANAKATIVEAHLGSAPATFQVVTQAVVEKNSSLTFVELTESPKSQVLCSSQFTLRRDSRLESTQLTLGGLLVRKNLSVLFTEPGAEAVVNGLYLGNESEHIDHQTMIDHAVGNTVSTQLYKGVLDDHARGVFTGGVRIRKDAQHANSSQLNNNLMLSSKAEIDTKPELEIEADDVKAAHGATIGQVNPDHIFYLQSRALTKQQAIEILAFGFAADIVDRISDKTIRSELISRVKHKFSHFKVTT